MSNKPDLSNYLCSICTASIKLIPEHSEDPSKLDMAALRLVGERYRVSATIAMTSAALNPEKPMPVLLAGRIESGTNMRGEYKPYTEWWITMVFLRAVELTSEVLKELKDKPISSTRFAFTHADALDVMLKCGEFTSSAFPKLGLTCKEFSPNDDCITDMYQVPTTKVEEVINDRLAISLPPLSIYMDHPDDSIISLRWPTEEAAEKSASDWLIRRTAQIWTGRDCPGKISPVIGYLPGYIPPESERALMQDVSFYGGKQFLEVGRAEAAVFGSALTAPEDVINALIE